MQAEHNADRVLGAIDALKADHVKPAQELLVFLQTGHLPSRLQLRHKETNELVFDEEGQPV
jgi:hypothetical protein